ncbi:DoxX family membrane protein, partial [Chlamydiota bacterium]
LAAILFELVGGLLILLGWYTRIGVYILMIFLVVTTLILHGFWGIEGHERAMQISHFLKNTAIFGGLLLLLSYGPGKWSLDACRCRSKE